MRPWRRKREERNARIEEARASAEKAVEEEEVSRGRLSRIREQYVEPMRKKGQDNGFARDIEDGLIRGWGERA